MKWLVNFEIYKSSEDNYIETAYEKAHAAYETWQQSEYYIEPYIARIRGTAEDGCGGAQLIFGIPVSGITKGVNNEGDDQTMSER